MMHHNMYDHLRRHHHHWRRDQGGGARNGDGEHILSGNGGAGIGGGAMAAMAPTSPLPAMPMLLLLVSYYAAGIGGGANSGNVTNMHHLRQCQGHRRCQMLPGSAVRLWTGDFRLETMPM